MQHERDPTPSCALPKSSLNQNPARTMIDSKLYQACATGTFLRPLLAHKSVRLGRVARVHERHEYGAELFEVDGLGKVTVETGVDALLVDVAEDVGRKCDDRLVRLLAALLPAADLFAGLVAVFVGHVEVAL